MSIERLSDLMRQLKVIEEAIQTEIQKSQTPTKKEIKIYKQLDLNQFQPICDLNYPKKTDSYYMVTLTFSKEIAAHSDEYGQIRRLEECLQSFKEYQLYACYEKHETGILHAHIMVNITDRELHDILLRHVRKHLTKSLKLEPAINYKPIKQTDEDIKRSLNYIIIDKKNHPIYKMFRIHVPKDCPISHNLSYNKNEPVISA